MSRTRHHRAQRRRRSGRDYGGRYRCNRGYCMFQGAVPTLSKSEAVGPTLNGMPLTPQGLRDIMSEMTATVNDCGGYLEDAIQALETNRKACEAKDD